MTTHHDGKQVAPRDGAFKQDPSTNTFEGKVIGMTGNKLVMMNPQGKESTHTLANDAKVTCDGADCKAEDLKLGIKVRVTPQQGDRSVAIHIESLDQHVEFAPRCS